MRVMKMLFGQNEIPSDGDLAYQIDLDQLDKAPFSKEDLKNAIELSIPGEDGEIVAVGGRPMYAHHAYIVNGYNEKDNTLSLSNPHDAHQDREFAKSLPETSA